MLTNMVRGKIARYNERAEQFEQLAQITNNAWLKARHEERAKEYRQKADNITNIMKGVR